MLPLDDTLSLPIHGGDLQAFVERYGPGDWLDFSANINPAGPPVGVLAALQAALLRAETLQQYPTSRERALRTYLAKLHRVEQEQIVLTNGAAAFIDCFAQTVASARCLIPQPAFSEYARALAVNGTQVVPFALDASADFIIEVHRLVQALGESNVTSCILTNPHNPSGSLLHKASMRTIIDHCEKNNVALLVDEAFIDYCPEESVLDLIHEASHLFVLRSLTKFYAMPGLRVGYAVVPKKYARQCQLSLPSWPISSLAIDAALAALQDAAYVQKTIAENVHEREEMVLQLAKMGIRVVPSAANFLMILLLFNASWATAYLAREHAVIVRDCTSYGIPGPQHYLRIAIRAPFENNRLLTALQAARAAFLSQVCLDI